VTDPVAFFPPGCAAPALPRFKEALARAIAERASAVFHVDPGNAGFLSRAARELAAGGCPRLDVELPAEDVAEDATEIAAERDLVPVLRRFLGKKPAGLDVGLSTSTGRPYAMPPSSLDLSTTDRCALRCAMCERRGKESVAPAIDPGEVARLVREAAEWGIPRVALTGAGEPFLDPRLLDHAELASSLGLLFTVTTSGLPVTGAAAARLARIRASVSVSIHGVDETHDRITGVPGSAARAWAAVRLLAAARDAAGASGNLSVHVSTVLSRANLGEIEGLLARSGAAGCDGHNLQPVNLEHGVFAGGRAVRRDAGPRGHPLWPEPSQAAVLDRLFDRLLERRGSGVRVNATRERLALMRRYFADPSRPALGVACRAGETFLGADHLGRVRPCYRLPWDLGHAAPGRLERLWNSRAYARVRTVIAECPLTCLNNCFFRKPA
jgi:MoaA/NifB/PqqE/SkfB family radical SAM enzyme